MGTEQQAIPAIVDPMTGRWRGQVLHAGSRWQSTMPYQHRNPCL